MTTTSNQRFGALSMRVGVIATAAALGLTGCSASGATTTGKASDSNSIASVSAAADPTKPEADTITGAVWQGAISAQWFLGASVAEKDYGLSLKSDWMTDATVGRAQLAAGEIDIVPGSPLGAVQLAQSGADALIVAGNYASGPDREVVYVMPDSGIKKIGDLAGKTLGTTALTGSWPNRVRLAMKAAGKDPSSLKIVATTYGDMADQLKAGTVDAVIAASFALPKVKALGAKPIFDVGAGRYAGRQENVWLTTKKYYLKHPNTIAAFQCSILTGGKLANQRSEMEKYMADVLKWNAALIANSPSPVSADGPLKLKQIQADWDDEVAINGSPKFEVASLVIPQSKHC
jgi:ABC-type nitrate/sulfonate/bicarbonate transport system substrate-binding protein